MNFDQFETRLQSLIEIQLLRILPGIRLEDVLLQKLSLALKGNIRTRTGERTFNTSLPDVISIYSHPGVEKVWQDPGVQSALLEAITSVVHEMGLSFSFPPSISFYFDDTIPIHDVTVVASYREETMADTQGMTNNEEADGAIPENAFLIIEGVKVFPLKVAVVNIGRRLDNELVIDDPRVSRNHAQLRVLKGRYVLFDLNSTGGTFVNGQKANQSVLYPGDVISLAGVSLIFGQDNQPASSSRGNTVPMGNRAGTDRPTAILRDRNTAEMNTKDLKK